MRREEREQKEEKRDLRQEYQTQNLSCAKVHERRRKRIVPLSIFDGERCDPKLSGEPLNMRGEEAMVLERIGRDRVGDERKG